MPRQRTANKHLPRNMVKRGPSFYFVTGGKYLNLGRDYSQALIKYAGMVGEKPGVNTVADLLAAFIEDRRRICAPATIAGYIHSAKNIGAVFGHMPLEAVTRADVYRYVKQAGNVQANRDRALLSAAYTFAANIGAYAGENPAKGLQERNEEAPRLRYVTDAELDAMLQAWDASLKAAGLNPGTTADLTVCVLFIAALLEPSLMRPASEAQGATPRWPGAC